MEVDSPEEKETQVFTPASRIAELNEIDLSVSTLLSAASDAVALLSNSPLNEQQAAALRNPNNAKTAFSQAAETYFSTLSSIEVRLRRQVYALEEAELIKPGDEKDTRRGRLLGGDIAPTRIGGGALDPSWLNARANDKVEEGMREELLVEARKFVQQNGLESNTTDNAESVTKKDGD